MSSTVGLLFLMTVFALHSQANGKYVYKTKYFKTKIDHFSSYNNDTFLLKYLVNDTYWEQKYGPIFFVVGSEAPIEMLCNSVGFVWEIAEEFKAMVVCAEHRYYGTSLPYGDESYDDLDRLEYLNSKQAMGDFVDLIKSFRHNNTLVRQKYKLAFNTVCNHLSTKSYQNPVITFGGSYGGILAAWLRAMHPNTVQGSIASSAPVYGFEGMRPCNGYFKITSSVFKKASVECGQTISSSWKAIDNVTETDEGKAWLSQNWKLCTPLTSYKDVMKLKRWNMVLYFYLAMANNPYPTKNLPANPVKKMCKYLNNHTEDDFTLLESVFRGINVFLNHTGTSQCTDYLYNLVSIPRLDQIGWMYQTCTEFVFPKCSDGINDIFEKIPWNTEEFANNCFDTFGLNQTDDHIYDMYTAVLNLDSASNIIFSNGLLDPWASVGVLEHISKTVQAVIIPESAHFMDLRASNVKDPKSVVLARETHKKWIRKWISNYKK